MKVIDLLNKVANGEELPKSIKYKDEIYNLYIDDNFINYEPECGDWLFNQYLDKLNDKIEIVEEPTSIKRLVFTGDGQADYTSTIPKINELIYKVNELEKRLDNEYGRNNN